MIQNPIGYRLFFAVLTLCVWAGASSAAEAAKEPNEWMIEHRVAIIGDNIINGHGLQRPEKDGVLAQMKQMIFDSPFRRTKMTPYARSGEVTATMIPQINAIAKSDADIVVVALGINDALYQVDPDIVYNNLDTILKELAFAGKYVLLVGYGAPRNLPHEYVLRFDSIYNKLLKLHRIHFTSNPMEGLERVPQYVQLDGFHLNARGSKILASRLTTALVKMLRKKRQYNWQLREKKIQERMRKFRGIK